MRKPFIVECPHAVGNVPEERELKFVCAPADYDAFFIVWKCPLGCGFTLNFDPAKYPAGITYLEESKEGKVLRFSTSKY